MAVGRKVGHGHRAGQGTALKALGGIVLFLVLGVVAALLFAPDKPPPPAVSAISYDSPPAQDTNARSLPTPSPGNRPAIAAEAASSGQEPTPGVKPKPVLAELLCVVKDAETGNPIPNASVTAQWHMAEEERQSVMAAIKGSDVPAAEAAGKRLLEDGTKETDTTNARGELSLLLKHIGEYTCYAGASGYLPVRERPITLAAGEKAVRIEFALAKGASVSGRVLERKTNRPAPNVRVTAHGDTAHVWGGEVRSNDNGEYTLTGFSPGDATISLDLHDAPYQAIGLAPAQKVSIATETQHLTGVDFYVEPAGMVWGYVLDSEKKPVKGDVFLSSSESVITQAFSAVIKQAPPIHARTREDGYYALVGVPLNSEWRVYFVSDKTAPQLSDPFLLTDSKRTVRVDLFTQRGSTIYGVTVDPDGQPIGSAGLICLPSYASIAGPMDHAKAYKDLRSDSDGSFKFEGIPAGNYQIMAQKDGYKIALKGEPVFPDGYHDVGPVRIVLTPVESGQYSVYGYVVDTANHAIPDARLTLAGMSGGSLMGNANDVKTDDRGYFVFYGVDPGYYVLTCEADGYAPEIAHEIKLDETTTIVMKATASVSGQVLVSENRQPPPSFNVVPAPRDGSAGGLFGAAMQMGAYHVEGGDSKGSFSIDLPAGSYTLTARADGYAPGSADITLAEGQHLDGVTIYVSERGSVIEGRVVVADGTSAAGAQVLIAGGGVGLSTFIEMADASGSNVERAGQDGSFRFDQLAPGTYQILARLGNYAQAHSDPINVGDRERVAGVQLVLGKGGTFEGYVMSDGAVLVGAAVTVAGNGYTNMTTTDRNGYYHMEGIPAGMYSAMAAKIDGITTGQFAPMHATVEIGEGQTTVHNFGEETGVDVTGYVTPAPTLGSVAYAVITVPGLNNLSGLSLNSPASWFDPGSAGMYLIDVKPIGSDGFFRLNVPPGDYELHIVTMSMGQVMAGDIRPSYTRPLGVQGDRPIQLDINLNQ